MAILAKYRYPWKWRDEMEDRHQKPRDDPNRPSHEEMMRSMKEEGDAMQVLLDASAALPKGEIVGVVLCFPRGDGYAFYIVTKERPLTLQWIPYSDAWQAEAATIRGIRRQDVEQQLEWQRKPLFGRSRSRSTG